ncbi:MAG: primosomal protein N' [Pseudohongiella sp.]|nr:primosomal protein N' [Pseudohongiella sp.]
MSDTLAAPPAHAVNSPLIARVAVPSPLRRSFDYLLPAELMAEYPDLQPGVRLRVPFGSRELTAVLLELDSRSDVEINKLKAVTRILDSTPLIPAHLLKLWLWAARYYQHPVGDALHTLMPAGLRGTAMAKTKRRASDSKSLVSDSSQPAEAARQLNTEQQIACEQINKSHGRYQGFLLDGVTGSGKTEIYLQAIAHTRAQGKQALVLVPEISLTPQTLARFRERFKEPIAVMHSGLTPRQRLNAWLAAASGEAGIIIGTRSAVFTPMASPGLIVIDEEHDGSFKQQDGFRYSARDLAVMRASTENIPIVLGSATPSLESLHNAATGRYQRLRLLQRAGDAMLPEFRLVDTQAGDLEQGFSRILLNSMQEHIKSGKQVLVFINRRGFAPVLQCRDCGWTAECKYCDARLTLHKSPPHLCCHHCERRQPVTQSCPSCGGKAMQAIGLGTERSEAFLQNYFPDTRVIRVDRDATRRKDDLDRLLNEVQSGEPCILVGTQMLAKGHHFPNVTLVAVLDADSGLFSADFRGQEFMAQLLMQVAGRAGRAETRGEVLIQTQHATHLSLQTLIHHGYHALAEQLLQERRQTDMPPITYMASLRAEAIKPEAPLAFLMQARNLIQQYCRDHQLEGRILVNGPLPAPMEKRANRFRQQLHLRAWQRQDLQQLLSEVCTQLELLPSQRQVRWSVDVDPQDMI